MINISIGLEGLQEALDKNARQIAALKPSGALGKAVQYGTIALHRYAVIDHPRMEIQRRRIKSVAPYGDHRQRRTWMYIH